MLTKKIRAKCLLCVSMLIISISGIAGAFSASKLEAPAKPIYALPADNVQRIRITGPEIPPKTGDENHPLLYAAISFISLSGLILTVKKHGVLK